MSEELYKEMAQCIIDGDSDVSAELARKAIERTCTRWMQSPRDLSLGLITSAISSEGEAFLPELWLVRR